MGIFFGRARPVAYVKGDFQDRGVTVGWLTRRRLSNYDQQRYQAVLDLAQRTSNKFGVERLKVDRLANMSAIDIAGIPEAVLDDQFVKGTTGDLLDLRGIELFWIRQRAELAKHEFLGERATTAVQAPMLGPAKPDKVRELVGIIKEERVVFRRLVEDADATTEGLMRALVVGVKKFKQLGFHATILRPVPTRAKPSQWCWQEHYRAEKWGEGAYQKGEYPKDTLLSVLLSQATTFLVDLEKPQSFVDQGLGYNPQSLAYDLHHSKGSPQMLVKKLVAADQQPFAVIYINNRVSQTALKNPPRRLFAPQDQELIGEELDQYFETVERAYDQLRARQQRARSVSPPKTTILPIFRREAILKKGELIKRQDLNVRLLEVPSEKIFRQIPGVIDWLRDAILGVYKGTKLAAGKSRDQLINELSLEDEKMLERVVYARYLALVEGGRGNSTDVRGVISGTVLDINHGGPGVVFKVPEAMVRKDARGRNLQTALAYEMVKRVFRKRWAELGLVKGFWRMLTKGIPFYATTQSLVVMKDMLRLNDLSVLRVIRGEKLSPDQQKIIEVASNGDADGRGVEANAYGGRVAIDEEEAGITLRRPSWPLHWPVLRTIFGKHLERLKREDQAIKDFFARELGANGRLHIVGFFTLGVALRVGLKLALTRFRRRFA